MAGKTFNVNILLSVLFFLGSCVPSLAYSYNELVLLVQAEETVFGRANYSSSLDERLNSLETSVLGKHLQGSDSFRLRAVCKSLGLSMPEAPALASPLEVIVKKEPSSGRVPKRRAANKATESNCNTVLLSKQTPALESLKPQLSPTVEPAQQVLVPAQADPGTGSPENPGQQALSPSAAANTQPEQSGVNVPGMLLTAGFVMALISGTGLVFVLRGQDEPSIKASRFTARRRSDGRQHEHADEPGLLLPSAAQTELSSTPGSNNMISELAEPLGASHETVPIFNEAAPMEENLLQYTAAVSQYYTVDSGISPPMPFSDSDLIQDESSVPAKSTPAELIAITEAGFADEAATELSGIWESEARYVDDSIHVENFNFNLDEFLELINSSSNTVQKATIEKPHYTEPVLSSAPTQSPVLSAAFASLIFGDEEETICAGSQDGHSQLDESDTACPSWPVHEISKYPSFSSVKSFRNDVLSRRKREQEELSCDAYHALAELLISAAGEKGQTDFGTTNTVSFPPQSRIPSNTPEYQYFLRNLFSEKTIA